MTLFAALFTGVSGLSATSQAIGVSSNNIANVNTTGYKASESQFSTLLATATDAGEFASGGVRFSSQQLVSRQGLLQNTGSATDLAISGNGFFTVTRGPDPAPQLGELLFTRAGSFAEDGAGFLRNSAGFYLQGWRLDAQGNLPANRNLIEPINLSDLTGTASPTTQIDLRANLQASAAVEAGYAAGDIAAGTVTPAFERTLEFFDTQGGAQPIRLSFVKTGSNEWAYEAIYDGDPADIGGAANNPVGTGVITFNTDGTIANVDGQAPASGLDTITVPFDLAASGLGPQTIDVNFGTPGIADGLTQFESASTLISSNSDGALFGGITGVNVDEDGIVTALFDNGVRRPVFKLPLATFPNANGLAATSGSAFLQTDESGDLNLAEANLGGAGSVASSALEASTVDLAEEFTDLITTQRAYSASTRIITTADEMLAELTQVL